jgi:hypothetical protein
MAERTFHALSIAFQTGLIQLDQDHQRQLIPGKKSPPVTHLTEDVKIILGAAKRVGRALAEMSVVQLVTHLNVRF